MDYYEFFKKRIAQVVNFAVEKRMIDHLVLYPFGRQGLLIKQILNLQYGIQEAFVIDQGLSKKNSSIKPLDYLNQIDVSKYIFVITSDNLNYWDEIRKGIRQYVKEENIIDMYLYKPFKYTNPRIAALEMAAREIYDKGIGGGCAEAGVYQGRFAAHINEFFYDRKLYLFDTFEGFSSKDIMVDRDNGYTIENDGHFGDTSVEIVMDKMKYRDNIIIKKGWFPETAQGLDETFCFVSLDMDLYQPIKAGLEFFYPRLLKGGYLFVHDCNISHSSYKGARVALLEFAEKENVGYVMMTDNSTAVITK